MLERVVFMDNVFHRVTRGSCPTSASLAVRCHSRFSPSLDMVECFVENVSHL